MPRACKRFKRNSCISSLPLTQPCLQVCSENRNWINTTAGARTALRPLLPGVTHLTQAQPTFPTLKNFFSSQCFQMLMRSPDVYCKKCLSPFTHFHHWLINNSFIFKPPPWVSKFISKKKKFWQQSFREFCGFCLNVNEHWLWGISFCTCKHLWFTCLVITEQTCPVKKRQVLNLTHLCSQNMRLISTRSAELLNFTC